MNNRNNRNKPKIVSVYSGAGGMDEGFRKAGFATVFATDNWPIACQTFIDNHPNAKVECDDIDSIDFSRVKANHPKIAGLVGGPPCPPFSKSRFYRKEKPRGMSDPDGFKTVSNFFKALDVLKPDFYVFENVFGFVYRPHKSALEYLITESNRLGYQISYDVLNAADYGVAQMRKRFFCIGVRKDMATFSFPAQTHFDPEKEINGNVEWLSSGDVLNDIDFDLPEDEKMKAGSKHKELLELVPPGDNYLFFTKERGHPSPLFEWRSRYWSFLLKLSPERPSWTIQASHSNNMGPFHWKNRFLRIQEIKRLQSFDDDYVFDGAFRDRWRQIGNAVPPRLAFAIADQIRKTYY